MLPPSSSLSSFSTDNLLHSHLKVVTERGFKSSYGCLASFVNKAHDNDGALFMRRAIRLEKVQRKSFDVKLNCSQTRSLLGGKLEPNLGGSLDIMRELMTEQKIGEPYQALVISMNFELPHNTVPCSVFPKERLVEFGYHEL